MYEGFYKLRGKPFSLLPDADFLFLSRRHGRAINHMELGTMAEAGFIVITGDIGAGKTTIVRHYLRNTDSNLTVGVINNAGASAGKLLGWIVSAFEIDHAGKDEVSLYNDFVTFLTTQYGKGRRTVLIIDEAQNLRWDVLEDLRMLSNVNSGQDQLLQIILVGQPELLETLKREDMQQFRQRITVHCHLDPLTAAETAGYIIHRLSVVGGGAELFDKDAIAAVHYYSGGVPRLINLLCDHALTYGFSEDRPVITAEIVAEVVADRQPSGLSPFVHGDQGWKEVSRSEDGKAIRSEIRKFFMEPAA
jgi:type II secretory pathway predicted ATPase ExeA